MDIMILVDEPNPVGALLEVRIIGAIEASEVEDGEKERNDRILAVTGVSHLYRRVKTTADLEPTFLNNLTQCWMQKNALTESASLSWACAILNMQ